MLTLRRNRSNSIPILCLSNSISFGDAGGLLSHKILAAMDNIPIPEQKVNHARDKSWQNSLDDATTIFALESVQKRMNCVLSDEEWEPIQYKIKPDHKTFLSPKYTIHKGKKQQHYVTPLTLKLSITTEMDSEIPERSHFKKSLSAPVISKMRKSKKKKNSHLKKSQSKHKLTRKSKTLKHQHHYKTNKNQHPFLSRSTTPTITKNNDKYSLDISNQQRKSKKKRADSDSLRRRQFILGDPTSHRNRRDNEQKHKLKSVKMFQPQINKKTLHKKKKSKKLKKSKINKNMQHFPQLIMI